MKYRCPGMPHRRARPLYATLLYTLISDSTIARCQPRYLFHDLRRPFIVKTLTAHLLRYLSGDPPVRFRVTQRLNCLAHHLHPPLRIGEGALLFGKAGGRQHHMGQPSGLCQKDILNHQKLQLLQRCLDTPGIGLTEYRVVTDEVDRPYRPQISSLIDLRQHPPRIGTQCAAPGFLKFLPCVWISHRLVPSIEIG